MDRMSIASGSSGSAVSSRTVNEWRPLYKFFINNSPMAEKDKALAEQNAKKQIKALKSIGWQNFDQLIQWVKGKIKERPTEKAYANKELWNKLNNLAVKGHLPSGISKSNLTDMTINYVKKFHLEKPKAVDSAQVNTLPSVLKGCFFSHRADAFAISSNRRT